MKQLSFAAAFAIFAAAHAYTPAVAQSKEGVYLTANDFINRKPSYVQEIPEQPHKVNADLPFSPGLVKVRQGDEVHLFRKSELFGYRDKYNQDFRFAGNRQYKVLDNAGFYLYSSIVEVSKGKERIKETKYFFSVQPDSDIVPLTKDNLKRAFPDKRDFHDLLDMEFPSDRDLTRYNRFHREYQVKSAFSRALGSLQVMHRG